MFLLGCRSSPPSCPASLPFLLFFFFFFPSPAEREDLGEPARLEPSRTPVPWMRPAWRDRTPSNKAAQTTRKITDDRSKMWSSSVSHRAGAVNSDPGKMARTQTRVFLLAVALLGIFFLGVSVKGQQQEEEEEEERSCQGAFDLYFVLDKWVSPFYLWLCYFLLAAHCHATAQLFGNAERISHIQTPRFSVVVAIPQERSPTSLILRIQKPFKHLVKFRPK